MGNYPRIACCLLGYRHRKKQRAPSLYYGQLEVQFDRYLVHIFHDHGFSQSEPTIGHSPIASVRRGLTTPSSALLSPLVSSPCPNANRGIGPLAIGLSDWFTLWLPRMNQTWKGESTKVYVVKGY